MKKSVFLVIVFLISSGYAKDLASLRGHASENMKKIMHMLQGSNANTLQSQNIIQEVPSVLIHQSWTNGIWVEYGREIVMLDTVHKKLETLVEAYTGTTYVPQSKLVASYFSRTGVQFLFTDLRQYELEDSVWTLSYFETTEYDSSGSIKTQTDGISQNGVPTTIYAASFTNNRLGNHLVKVEENMDLTIHRLVQKGKTEYMYAGDDRTLISTKRYIKNGEEWEEYEHSDFENTFAGFVKAEHAYITYQATGETPESEYGRTTYLYDGNNNLLVKEYLLTPATIPVLDTRETRTFNQDNQVVTYLLEQPNGAGVQRTTAAYNTQKQIESYTYESYFDGTWMNSFKTIWQYSATTPGSTLPVEKEERAENGFVLHGNYPNPFNPSTKIIFSLKEAGYVALRVYDNLGREVSKLIDGDLQAGNHEVSFTAYTLSSGIYYCQLSVRGKSALKKMMLLR